MGLVLSLAKILHRYYSAKGLMAMEIKKNEPIEREVNSFSNYLTKKGNLLAKLVGLNDRGTKS